jgi:hypothetical protein
MAAVGSVVKSSDAGGGSAVAVEATGGALSFQGLKKARDEAERKLRGVSFLV